MMLPMQNLKQKLRDELVPVLDGDQFVPSEYADLTEYVVEKVWEVLADEIGATQEKLFNDLTYARTERDAAQREVEAVREAAAQMQARLQDEINGLRAKE